MPVQVVVGIYHLMPSVLELEEMWEKNRLVLMSYLHHLAVGGAGKQSTRLGERRSLPKWLALAVFVDCLLTLSVKSQCLSLNKIVYSPS